MSWQTYKKRQKVQAQQEHTLKLKNYEKILGWTGNTAPYVLMLLALKLKSSFAIIAASCLSAAIFGLRAYVFYKIPKRERPVYPGWPIGFELGHPVWGIMAALFLIVSIIYWVILYLD